MRPRSLLSFTSDWVGVLSTTIKDCWAARNGAVVRALASHQRGPGSNPGVDPIWGLSLLLVLSFAPRGFSPSTPVFPFPQKPTFSNSNPTRNQADEEPLRGCATSKSLFIYLFIYFIIMFGGTKLWPSFLRNLLREWIASPEQFHSAVRHNTYSVSRLAPIYQLEGSAHTHRPPVQGSLKVIATNLTYFFQDLHFLFEIFNLSKDREKKRKSLSFKKWSFKPIHTKATMWRDNCYANF